MLTNSTVNSSLFPLQYTATVPRQAKGFTLIEVMVVVFIIGIILTFAKISIGPSEYRQLKEEGLRIATLIELARQEAILDAQELSLVFKEKEYYFQVFNGEQWTAIEGDNILRLRTLPKRMQMDITIDGEPIEIATLSVNDEIQDDEEPGDDEKKTKKDEDAVRIFLLSSGEMTPFELFLRFEDEENGFLLTGTAVGEMEFKPLKNTL